jgi:hypothetical protein
MKTWTHFLAHLRFVVLVLCLGCGTMLEQRHPGNSASGPPYPIKDDAAVDLFAVVTRASTPQVTRAAVTDAPKPPTSEATPPLLGLSPQAESAAKSLHAAFIALPTGVRHGAQRIEQVVAGIQKTTQSAPPPSGPPLGSNSMPPAAAASVPPPAAPASAASVPPPAPPDEVDRVRLAVAALGNPAQAPVVPVAEPASLPPAAPSAPPTTSAPVVELNPGLILAGCASCGGGALAGLPPPHAPLLPPSGDTGECNCGSNCCVPGKPPCYPCTADNYLGRLLCGLYGCICCPDPCYEPRWTALAESAFFVDGARPVTTQRLRWDRVDGLDFPDRSEYFWARADGAGKGPTPLGFQKSAMSTSVTGVPGVSSVTGGAGMLGGPVGGGQGTAPLAPGRPILRYDSLTLYTETAAGKVSVIVEMPYLAIKPNDYSYAAGFGDMNIGTKTLLFDCELLQIALLFRTYLPTGNFNKGLGTGHVSLEPSLVVGLKLAPDTYFQGQIAEAIPIGGDSLYQGPVLRINGSLNQVVYRILPDVPLIATLEFETYSFQGGAFTDLETGLIQKASGVTYAALGPGLRLSVCDKIDFGVGSSFAITPQRWGAEQFRTEFRFRF